MITLETLKSILDKHFSAPYLEDGLVSCDLDTDEEDGTKTLFINIGRRDVEIDEDGKVVGAGTFIGDPD